MVWGRDLAHLSLDTRGGPAFKPLPVFAGAVLAPLGGAAPWLWLVVARAGALLAAAMAWRLARRLGGGSPKPGGSVVAGAVAAAGVLLCGGWLWNGWLGNAEGLFLALVLVAAERALDGRHRVALALGFAACLLRLEAAPFLLVYGCWVGRRDSGARVWVAAAMAALPVAWLGPDLIGSGDPFRSSARARIPNPGAPALAERPALESLRRAVALAPLAIWAGAALALVGIARRGLPRIAALPLAAGAAWVALVASMSELGYSGEERYAMPGIALVAITAGAGAGWAVKALLVTSEVDGRGMRWRLGPSLALVLLVTAAAEQAPALRGDADALRYEARVYNSLDDAVAAAGGAGAVRGCGPIHTARYSRPALAWHLRVPLHRLSTEPASRGIAFRARTYRGAPLTPAVAGGGLRPLDRAGPWQVLANCRDLGNPKYPYTAAAHAP